MDDYKTGETCSPCSNGHKQSLKWSEEEKNTRHHAQLLIAKVYSGCVSDEKWLSLEAEIHDFFNALPQDLRVIVGEMFAEDGAGEMLYMVCSGIRYQNNIKEEK